MGIVECAVEVPEIGPTRIPSFQQFSEPKCLLLQILVLQEDAQELLNVHVVTSVGRTVDVLVR